MSGQKGTIVELDPDDALGWIELDEGGRVRFGGTSLKEFETDPGVGTRVEVRGTRPGYKGVPKAEEVGPLLTDAEARAVLASKIPWPRFVHEHPRWSDAAETCVPCVHPAPRPTLAEHPLFSPWRHEICETAPTVIGLSMPTYGALDAIEPGPDDCFAHGLIAFLEEPRWPSCGVCARPLEMCLQVSPALLAEFLSGGRGLVALFCFHCHGRDRNDPRAGHVRLVEPRHRVVGPEAWVSASSGWCAKTQRVTPGPRAAVAPSASWCGDRSERVSGTASSALFGFETPALIGPFPAGVTPMALRNLSSAYGDWLGPQPGGDQLGQSRLGGVPTWDQADQTPSCAHGEMLHLLDYNGGQFLDGALHVFVCRKQACDVAFVAEF